MTKAAFCVQCSDIVAPLRDFERDRSWRWCQCEHMGVRWRDGRQGLLEVTQLNGEAFVRVLGFNNMFLEVAAGLNQRVMSPGMNEDWRALHDATCQGVEPHYLFHADKRNCWALVVKVGQSGDVFFIPYATARSGDLPTEVTAHG